MSVASYTEYAAGRDDPRFTDWLRERAEPDWSDAIGHRFTEELGDGTLDDDVFREYLIQDYAFVSDLVSVVGYAVGQAPTMAAKAELSGFLATVTSDEDEYFERSFDALAVPRDDRDDPAPAPVTERFGDLLAKGALAGDYEETLAVLLPAEWIYRAWATRAADGSPSRFYLSEWVDLHANPDFDAFVSWLRRELDTYGPPLSERRRGRVARLFERVAELEVAFFDAAYSEAGGGHSPSGDR